jgi:type I restriction enzyme S subunit
MGQAPPGDACNTLGTGTLFVKAGEFGVNRPVEREWTTKPLKFGRRDDVFICVVGATCGKLNLGTDCAIGRSVAAIQPCDLIDQFFLYFQLQTQVLILRQASAGSAQGVLNKKQLSEVEVQLPPLNEQRRIVAKIEELFSDLDAGVAALERAKANLKRYRASVLKAAVEGKLTEAWRAEHPHTEPASKLLERILAERRRKWEADQLAKFAAAGKQPPKNWRDKYVEPTPPDTTGLPGLPEGWCWVSANQLCSQITDGEHIQPPYQVTGFPMLTATHVRNGRVEFKDVGLIAESDFLRCLQRCAPTKGDVLIVSVGATTGRAGMVQESPPFALVRSVLLLKPIMLGSFLLRWIQSPWCQNWINRASGASAQAHFYISDAKRMPVPFAPMAEQEQIVTEVAERLSQLEAAHIEIEHSQFRAARLRQSILKQAFEGKLVPQDPTDEPASVLLERVRASRLAPEAQGKTASSSRTRGRRGQSKSKMDLPEDTPRQ